MNVEKMGALTVLSFSEKDKIVLRRYHMLAFALSLMGIVGFLIWYCFYSNISMNVAFWLWILFSGVSWFGMFVWSEQWKMLSAETPSEYLLKKVIPSFRVFESDNGRVIGVTVSTSTDVCVLRGVKETEFIVVEKTTALVGPYA